MCDGHDKENLLKKKYWPEFIPKSYITKSYSTWKLYKYYWIWFKAIKYWFIESIDPRPGLVFSLFFVTTDEWNIPGTWKFMKKFIDIICISHEIFRLIRLFFIIYVYLFITCIYNHFYMILLAPTENTKGYAILWDVRPIYDEYLITFWRWWDHMSISYTIPKND